MAGRRTRVSRTTLPSGGATEGEARRTMLDEMGGHGLPARCGIRLVLAAAPGSLPHTRFQVYVFWRACEQLAA
jgi:hypothetical protein